MVSACGLFPERPETFGCRYVQAYAIKEKGMLSPLDLLLHDVHGAGELIQQRALRPPDRPQHHVTIALPVLQGALLFDLVTVLELNDEHDLVEPLELLEDVDALDQSRVVFISHAGLRSHVIESGDHLVDDEVLHCLSLAEWQLVNLCHKRKRTYVPEGTAFIHLGRT